MVDLTTHGIKKIFENQIRELTQKSLYPENSFDLQFSGGWLQ